MALIKCDECGADVSDKAAACPKCGNPTHASALDTSPIGASATPRSLPSKPNPSAARKLGGTLAAIVVVAIVVMAYQNQSTPPSSSTNASSRDAVQQPEGNTDGAGIAQVSPASSDQTTAPTTLPVIEISATQLYEEYKANEVLADTKYKGRWLYVSGVVTEIGKDFTGDPYVSLLGENEYATVRATFAKSAIQQLAALHQGQQIAVTCQGKGKIIDSPILDCTSDNVPPRPPHPPAGAEPQAVGATTPGTATQQPEASTIAASESAATVPTSFPTSFDCAKARSGPEHLICGDAELAADDVELAGLYAKAKAAATDAVAFQEHVRQQWNSREISCHDRDCLVQWYADQKQWFTNIMNGQTGGAAQSQVSQPPPAPTYQTSFDCSAPTSPDEQAICHDPGLAAMDRELAAQYAAAVKRVADPAKLQVDENGWGASRRDCAGDLNCLRHAYGVRIDQLQRS